MKRGFCVNKSFLILGIFIFSVISIISLVSALPIYVKPLSSSGSLQPSTSFDYVFNFTNNSDCSGVVLTNSSTITTGKDGVGFIDINITSMTGLPNYLCEYKDGVLRKTHSLSDSLFKDIYVSKIMFTNKSYGVYSNSTDVVFGYIEGL